MKNHRRQTGLMPAALFAAVAVLSSLAAACGDPLPPDVVTWEKDVYPIVKARCIRCHDNPLRKDPALAPTRNTIPNFNHPLFADLQADAAAIVFAGMLDKYVTAKMAPATTIMPPPPAEPLQSWQIEMIQIWVRSPK